MTHVDRRTLLMGTAGSVILAACSSDGDETSGRECLVGLVPQHHGVLGGDDVALLGPHDDRAVQDVEEPEGDRYDIGVFTVPEPHVED